MKISMPVSLIALLAVALILGGCGRDGRENEVATKGMIKYIDLEGGFFGLIGDDGQGYDPINLPDKYRLANRRVHFKGIIRHDMVSVNMWGVILELTEIIMVPVFWTKKVAQIRCTP